MKTQVVRPKIGLLALTLELYETLLPDLRVSREKWLRKSVLPALKKQAEHGIFGYPLRPRSYLDAVVSWVESRHGWRIDPIWLTYSPGVVTALNLCVLTYSRPGDGVIVQPPVYYPFYRTIENNGSRLFSILCRASARGRQLMLAGACRPTE